MTSGNGGSRSPGSETTDHDPSAPRALPHIDALDSLRAIAVLGVLAYHHDPGRMPGGWLGVSVFFTLSGFLVANLLLVERHRSGGVALGRFWSRRIRRLLPASVLAIGLAFVVAWAEEGIDASTFATDVRAAILNVANWRFIANGVEYADAGSIPSPVQHYWSLAIEEQFYVVLPLLVVVCLPRRRVLAGVVAATIVVSLALQLTLDGVDRVYFGTDTRAAELAVGVGLAMALPWLRSTLARAPWFADALGATSLLATVVLFATVELDATVVGSGALLAVTVLWVGLVVGAVLGRRFARALRVPGLPGLGRISYGVYLYHWPVYLLLNAGRVGVDGAPLLALRVGVTLALAGLSAALVELPIRRSEWRPTRAVAFAGCAVVAVLVTSVVAGPPGVEATTVAGATLVTAPEVTTTSTPPTSAPPSTSTTVAEPTPSETVPTTTTQPPVTAPAAHVPRVLAVGDSTIANLGLALQEYGAANGLLDVQLLWSPGCTVVPYDVAVVRPGFEFVSPCEDVLPAAADLAIDQDMDAVLVMMGTLQLTDARYPGLAELHTVLDREIEDRYRAAMRRTLGRLGEAGIPVLWADLPTPDWDIDAMGETQGIPVEGTGEATTNDPRRAAKLNAIDAEVLAEFPLAGRWGWTQVLAGPDGVIDDDTRYDGVHIRLGFARQLVESSVYDLLETTYRTLAPASGDPSPSTWDLPSATPTGAG